MQALGHALAAAAESIARGDLAACRKHYEHARTLCQSAGLPAQEAGVLLALAGLCIQGGDPRRAIDGYREAADLAARHGAVDVEWQAWMGAGAAALMLKQPGAAQKTFDKASQLARQQASPLWLVEALHAVGRCHMLQGREKDAAVVWQQALTEGAALDDATWNRTSLRVAGDALLEILTRHKLTQRIAQVRGLMRPVPAR